MCRGWAEFDYIESLITSLCPHLFWLWKEDKYYGYSDNRVMNSRNPIRIIQYNTPIEEQHIFQ